MLRRSQLPATAAWAHAMKRWFFQHFLNDRTPEAAVCHSVVFAFYFSASVSGIKTAVNTARLRKRKYGDFSPFTFATLVESNTNFLTTIMTKRFFLLPVLAMFLFASCADDEKNARLEVWLTDAPGDYEEVNIDIQGVEIHSNTTDDGKGWKQLDVNEGVYNLLELTNGLDTLLGEIEIPAGKVSQIRLILGDNNTIKLKDDDTIYDLTTPSAQQSGLKLQVHETLVEGITYKILLDFDVARSVTLTGSGHYKLKPVIRTITEAQDGAIKGEIEPADATPAVYAVVANDTVATSFADTTGHFLIRGLPAGTYNVLFAPASGYQPTQRTGVSVQIGQVTDLGVVTIE